MEQKNNENPDLSFVELETGLTLREAFVEAKRCLNCSNPVCRSGYPVNNNIPAFIKAVSIGNIGLAHEILSEKTNLPSVCGRVCPREKQCEAHCILSKKNKSIKIGKLERFVSDFVSEMHLIKTKKTDSSSGKVAVIGSGPAGITVAGDLLKLNFGVTVFESQPEAGGVLMYGIPDYRLPKIVVKREIQKLINLGVEIKTGVMIGRDITVDEVFNQGFDAIFIGTGNALPKTLEIPGNNLHNIAPAIYFLHTLKLVEQGKLHRYEIPVKENQNVIIVGGGNVAVDAARMAKRIKANKVTMLFRESKAAMPALKSEVDEAISEGVELIDSATPVKFESKDNEFVNALTYLDSENKEITLNADVILVAVGQRPAARIVSTTQGIEVDKSGFVKIKTKPFGMTTRKGVFAGGDVVHGPATVVLAMREAKQVAQGIIAYIEAKKLLGEE